jgi:hypothetical protein
VFSAGDSDEPCSGQTLWCDETSQHATGVAWDWVEIREGVVAMSDPFGLVTNLRLTDDDGDVLDPTRVAVHLNQIVHALPWQREVARMLRKPS